MSVITKQNFLFYVCSRFQVVKQLAFYNRYKTSENLNKLLKRHTEATGKKHRNKTSIVYKIYASNILSKVACTEIINNTMVKNVVCLNLYVNITKI